MDESFPSLTKFWRNSQVTTLSKVRSCLSRWKRKPSIQNENSSTDFWTIQQERPLSLPPFSHDFWLFIFPKWRVVVRLVPRSGRGVFSFWDLKKKLFCLRKPADIENIDIKGHPTSSSMQSEAQCRRRVLLHVLASRTTWCGQQLASSSPRRWSVVEKNSCWCFLRRYNVSRDAIRNKCRRLAPFLLSVSPVVFSLSFICCWLAGGGKTAPVLILALIHRKSRFKTIQSVHLSAIMPAHATKEQAQSSGKHQPIDSYLFADFPPEHLWWIDPHMVLSLFLTNWPKNGIGDLLAARILRLG